MHLIKIIDYHIYNPHTTTIQYIGDTPLIHIFSKKILYLLDLYKGNNIFHFEIILNTYIINILDKANLLDKNYFKYFRILCRK